VTNQTTPPALWRDDKHDHFWIEDGELYESYRTLRGLRWRHRLSVPETSDSERCSEDEIAKIEASFLLKQQPCGCHDDPTYGHVVMARCPLHD
jgi:hypothetical protein